MKLKDINWGHIFTLKRIIFLLIFFALVLIGKNINFSMVLGAKNQFFTLFQFFGPVAGSFLGPVFGIVTVFFSQLADFFIMGKEATWINLFRFLPMLLAVYYFGSKRKLVGVIVPLTCMVLFIIHPVGGQAWFYSLFWLIPILGKVLPEKVPGQLFFKSYGATFTAHALGSILWLYTVPSTATMWMTLIPIVAYERFLFGLGIAISFVVLNTVLDYVISKWKVNVPNKVLFLDSRYNLLQLLHLKKFW